MPAFLYYKHLLANKFYQSSEKNYPDDKDHLIQT